MPVNIPTSPKHMGTPTPTTVYTVVFICSLPRINLRKTPCSAPAPAQINNAGKTKSHKKLSQYLMIKPSVQIAAAAHNGVSRKPAAEIPA